MTNSNSKLIEEIPSLDLDDFRNNLSRDTLVKALGDGFSAIGFVAVRNHYLTDDLVNNLYKNFESFFQLDDSVKEKYYRPELFGQRGYVPKRKENAKGSTQPDLKEFYHIGQVVSQQNLFELGYPTNIWPAEVKRLQSSCEAVYEALEQTGLELLRAIALFLCLEEEYFESKVVLGNSILRAIHYFPLAPKDIKNGSVRAGAHGDINLITLLMGASAEGLEVKRNDGNWIPITALPNQLIVNVADMLERLTNGVLKSTLHRVVNPPLEQLDSSRYSMPFFMHPNSDMDLSCLKSCVTEKSPKSFKDITAGDFLNERLKEIGLVK